MVNVEEWISDRKRPENTVHYGKTQRFLEAEKQFQVPPANRQDIIRWTNEFIVEYRKKFLQELEVQAVENEIRINGVSVTDYLRDFNKRTKEKYELTNMRDIVWMKFASTGHLGVVACSNDVNFDFPADQKSYDERRGSRWKYNTSGIILHYLSCHGRERLEWDQSSFLVFPLQGLESGREGKRQRRQLETGIGNYLIYKGVPILDYYSHRI